MAPSRTGPVLSGWIYHLTHSPTLAKAMNSLGEFLVTKLPGLGEFLITNYYASKAMTSLGGRSNTGEGGLRRIPYH